MCIGGARAAGQEDAPIGESNLELIALQLLAIGRLTGRRLASRLAHSGVAPLLAEFLDGSRPFRTADHTVGHTFRGRDAGLDDLVVCLDAELVVSGPGSNVGSGLHCQDRPFLEGPDPADPFHVLARRADLSQRMDTRLELGCFVLDIERPGVGNPCRAELVEQFHAMCAVLDVDVVVPHRPSLRAADLVPAD